MNILYVIPWDQSQGGVTHVAASLARSLEARGHRGFFFFPASGRLLRSRTSLQGFPAIECRLAEYPKEMPSARSRLSWLSAVVTALPQLAAFALANQIDIINVHYPESSFALLADLARRLRIPLVISAHGELTYRIQGPPTVAPGIVRLLEHASAVIVPSHTYLCSVVEAYPSVETKAGYIYNGFWQEELDMLRSQKKAEGVGTVVLCIAALIHKKGIDVLLRALQACRDERLSLRMIGAGPLRSELEGLAATLGISHRVTFLGAKSRKEVFEELSNCDVVVQPSRHASESFGRATLEGMGCGKPVVASAIGGLNELVDDRVTGLLVRPEDPADLARALDDLSADPALRQKLGDQGRAKAQRFTVHATADAYERLFTDLIAKHPIAHSEPVVAVSDQKAGSL